MSSNPDPFLRACHGTDPIRLEVRRPGGVASEMEFAKPHVLVGRDGRADLVLANPDVAVRSLYFQLIGGRVFAVRVSEAPVRTTDGRAWEAGWVRPADEFEVGWVTLRVLNPDQRTPGTPPVATDPLAPRHDGPEYAFEALHGKSNPPRRFPHRQELLLVGREAPCRFLVRHPDVSRCHAAVVHTPAGPWVVDLLSRTGVTVNGGRVPAAPLRDGDRVEFGSVGVRVRLGGREPAREQPGEPTPEQIAQFQQQAIEQLRAQLAAMMQMVGGVLNDQRRFLHEEMERLKQLVAAVKAGEAGPAGPPADRDHLEAWASHQPDPANRQRTAEDADIGEKLEGHPRGD